MGKNNIQFDLTHYEQQPDGTYKKSKPKKKLKSDEGDFYIEFDVSPMGKPRMTQQDKWKKRPVTDRYWQLKDNIIKIAKVYNFTMPESNYHMIFHIEMPKSWSKKKKEEYDGEPHQNKPDKDNLEKAVLDALCKEDSYIWDGRVTKYWAYKSKIIIKPIN